MQKCKNCSNVCAYHCAQLSYTTRHRAVDYIPSYHPDKQQSLNEMLSIGGEGALKK